MTFGAMLTLSPAATILPSDGGKTALKIIDLAQAISRRMKAISEIGDNAEDPPRHAQVCTPVASGVVDGE